MKIKSLLLSLSIIAAAAANAQDEETPALPQSLLAEMDSLTAEWYVAHYLTIDGDCIDGAVNPSFPDSVYANRIESLPTVIEMTYNPQVRSAIDTYTVRSRKNTAAILGLFPLYEDIFVEALQRYGLPMELKYVPIIESALKTKAYSHMGAAGMWQFIYSTGHKYGLESNSLLDDRYDVYRATDAAARHFKDLYDIYKDWSLAISAYNCGTGNINKAIARSGSKDFWVMYPYLPKETRGYLPAFIAINYVMAFYKEHGICPAAASISPATDTICVSHNLHFGQIEEMSGASREEIRAYNPQYTGEIVPGAYRTCVLTLPTRYILPLVQAGDSLYTHNQDKYFPKSKAAAVDNAMMNRPTYITHKIKNGESLSTIAAKYHTSVKKIKSWNNLTSDRIRAGKTLKIYR